MKKILLTVTLVLSAFLMMAQGVTGTVTDDAGEGLPGATVLVKGTQNGAITDVDGKFTLDVSEGTLLVVSFMGFESQEATASNNMEVTLQPGTSILAEVVITSNVIDVVKSRETPVAVSSISPAEISLKVGNQEFPEIMNRTPGVYATKNGGGYGDSRLSLRGFDQSNTSFLINGQPVNDMENGWVYWSNWQGLTDVASGIQIQRGLGASRLAVPSVGGTVSIFTKAAELAEGGKVSQTIGNDGYLKSTVSYSTGKNENGWAASFLLSRWQGDGYVYNTKGEGWTYFAAFGYAPEGSNHEFNFSALGAGQWHHQRDAWVSIRDYQNFGSDHKEGIDRRWNTNGGTLNGEEYNMRRNFYNKPLFTFNWDWEINENLSLATSLYASTGRGGGTGPRGQNYFNSDIDILPFNRDLTEHYLENGNGTRDSNGFIDFDEIVRINRETTSGYNGPISDYAGYRIGSNGYNSDNVNNATLIRRASMNSHNWFGGISTLDYESGNFRYSLGIDLRKYTGYHYRALNDLLGLDGYFSTGNDNTLGLILEPGHNIQASPFRNTGLSGPKIDYYNIGYVDWQGLNGLVEYSGDAITAVIQAGVSNQGFKREDLFDQIGNPISEQKNLTGGYLKGGANYNLNSAMNVFFNAGYISRQPLFDAVFPGFANDVNPDLQNEQITSVEVGYGYLGRYLTVNFNAYSTTWGNRFISESFPVSTTQSGTAQFKDVDVLHQGIEIEATYRPIDNLKLRGMLSAGDWRYTKDFTAAVFDDSQNEIGEVTLYLDDVKVGDAAQFTAFLSAEYTYKSYSMDLAYRFVDGLYADYSITDSDLTVPDNQGALKLPSYGLFDLGATARFELLGTNGSFRLNVNNLFDKVYIAESNTNIHTETGSETWEGIDVRNSVWFGFGRTWNATLSFNF
ncbi:TonB-dependent receptor [Ekhidna sp.]|jgi:outer membrane cobalamin receptor|uniref:TonB-dependent receptor n=1 Tax=Ekhidna sp. TaxID=2608089 RepID=UPI0032EB25FC